MTSISNKLDQLAAEIVKKLDSMDKSDKSGKSSSDGKISSDIWNVAFDVKSKGGKEINNCIFAENAQKSVKYYLKQNSKSSGMSVDDLGAKWLKDLDDIQNGGAKVENTDVKPKEIVAITDKVPEKTDKAPKSADNSQDVSKYFDNAYSINNKSGSDDKSDIFNLDWADKINKPDEKKHYIKNFEYDKYVQLAKYTNMSSLKSSDVPIHDELFEEAYNNVLKGLMKRGGKKESVLTDAAKYFMAAADKNDVDVFTLVGISWFESSYGTSVMARTKNNVGGLTPNGKDGITCTSVADSIKIASDVLRKNIDRGYENIKSVGMEGNYCVADDNVRQRWVNSVTYFAKTLREEYNKLLQDAQTA